MIDKNLFKVLPNGDICVHRFPDGRYLFVAQASKRRIIQFGLVGFSLPPPYIIINNSIESFFSGKELTDIYTSDFLINFKDVLGNIGCLPAIYCRRWLVPYYDIPNLEELKIIIENKEKIDEVDKSDKNKLFKEIEKEKSKGFGLAMSSVMIDNQFIKGIKIKENEEILIQKNQDVWLIPVRTGIFY